MATDYLLEIDGIKGESKDKKHKETIEINSFSWGLSQSASFYGGGGGGAGKASFQDITFTTQANKTSPLLANRCATGEHIKKATLFVRKAGKEQLDYYKIVLEDLIVTSFQNSGGGGDIPSESFSLAYAKIKYEYQEQDEKGAIGGPVPFTYNIKENTVG